MSEQDVHEIQLNGKQLVFMFMAATVVSVVIFLCGVMVGRGVRPPVQTLTLGSDTQAETSALDTPGTPIAPLADVADGTPQEPLTYAERLESAGPERSIKRSAPVTSTPSVPPAVVNEPAPAKEPAVLTRSVPPAKETPAATTSVPQATIPAAQAPPAPVAQAPAAKLPVAPAPRTSQAGNFVLQVRAVSTHDAATALADRLKADGFPAFVIENPEAVRDKYRVRVGYATKSDADAAAARLKQQKFEPWVIP